MPPPEFVVVVFPAQILGPRHHKSLPTSCIPRKWGNKLRQLTQNLGMKAKRIFDSQPPPRQFWKYGFHSISIKLQMSEMRIFTPKFVKQLSLFQDCPENWQEDQVFSSNLHRSRVRGDKGSIKYSILFPFFTYFPVWDPQNLVASLLPLWID